METNKQSAAYYVRISSGPIYKVTDMTKTWQ